MGVVVIVVDSVLTPGAVPTTIAAATTIAI
jgi:hypothetical protein